MDTLKFAPLSAVPSPVSDLDGLHALLSDLFGHARLSFVDHRLHQTMFFVPGTVRAVQQALASRTAADLWSGEGRLLTHYNDDVGNWCLSLSRGGPGLVLVFSTVLSLHRQYLAEVSMPDRVAGDRSASVSAAESVLHAC